MKKLYFSLFILGIAATTSLRSDDISNFAQALKAMATKKGAYRPKSIASEREVKKLNEQEVKNEVQAAVKEVMDKKTITKFQQMLDEGFDPNTKGIADPNQTLLGFAITNGRADLVKALLDTQDIDVEMESGTADFTMTPLQIAAYFGYFDIGEELINKGARIDYVGSYGITPMAIAQAQNKQLFVQMLVKHGGSTTA